MEEEVSARNVELLGDHDQLQARLDRYRSLFEQAPVAYLVTDRFGVVSDANRRAAELLGTVRRFLIGRPLAVFVDGDDRAACATAWATSSAPASRPGGCGSSPARARHGRWPSPSRRPPAGPARQPSSAGC
jgi:PAS domain-containing protein